MMLRARLSKPPTCLDLPPFTNPFRTSAILRNDVARRPDAEPQRFLLYEQRNDTHVLYRVCNGSNGCFQSRAVGEPRAWDPWH